MKVYISGPIKDTPDYKLRFDAARRTLVSADHEVINPCLLGEEGFTYEQYMRVDLQALLECDAVYMLGGWERSAGARCEHLVAAMCGMEIIYQRRFG